MSSQLFCTSPFTLTERAPGTDWRGGWMGPRIDLDSVRKIEFLVPAGNWNPIPQLSRLWPNHYSDWAATKNKHTNSHVLLRQVECEASLYIVTILEVAKEPHDNKQTRHDGHADVENAKPSCELLRLLHFILQGKHLCSNPDTITKIRIMFIKMVLLS